MVGFVGLEFEFGDISVVGVGCFVFWGNSWVVKVYFVID